MINGTLYKQGLKGIWKMLVLFGAVLSMYITVIIIFYDPKLGNLLGMIANAAPQLLAAFGMTVSSSTLGGFLAAYLYGFLLVIFPMVFSILTANKLLARHVDRGSMVYLLAAPTSRTKAAFTQLLVLLTGITTLVVYAALLGVTVCAIMFPGQLDVGPFLRMNVGALGVQLFIGGICFLASAWANDTKYSIGFGAGIPALAFIIQMMSNAGGKALQFVKYCTFLTLFNPNGLLEGTKSAYCGAAILFVGAVALYAAAIIIFRKKDLSI